MSERTIPVKMSKATPEDLRIVREFFQMLEEIGEYQTWTPENPNEEEESIPVETHEAFANLVTEAWRKVAPCWSRVVFGCEILIDNCCDPDADVLEWKPEIKRLIEQSNQIAGG